MQYRPTVNVREGIAIFPKTDIYIDDSPTHNTNLILNKHPPTLRIYVRRLRGPLFRYITLCTQIYLDIFITSYINVLREYVSGKESDSPIFLVRF